MHQVSHSVVALHSTLTDALFDTDTWKSEKERFLRHPSLRRKHKEASNIVAKPMVLVSLSPPLETDEVSTSAIATPMLPDRNSELPPRPLRAPSSDIDTIEFLFPKDDTCQTPAVIVTSCASSIGLNEAGGPSAHPRIPPLPSTQENDTRRGLRSEHQHLSPTVWKTKLNRLRKPFVGVQDPQKDLPDPFNDSVNAVDSPNQALPPPLPSSAPGSFESGLTKNLKDSVDLASNTLSAVSDFFVDLESGETDTGLQYTTSTPVLTQSQNLDQIDFGSSPDDTGLPFEVQGLSEKTVQQLYNGHGQLSVIKPSILTGERDSLPYPDIFDLDMYYGVLAKRWSVASTKSTRDSRASFLSLGLKTPTPASRPSEKPSPSTLPYLLKSPSETSSLPGSPASTPMLPNVRRFGMVVDNFAGGKVAVDHEVKRFRDHYRPPGYTTPPSTAASGKENLRAFVSPSTSNPRLNLLGASTSFRLSRPIAKPVSADMNVDGNKLLKTPPAVPPRRQVVGLTGARTNPSLGYQFKITNPSPSSPDTDSDSSLPPRPHRPSLMSLKRLITPAPAAVTLSHDRFGSLPDVFRRSSSSSTLSTNVSQ